VHQVDVVLRGGQVIDGTGRPAFSADVGIEGGRIVAVGEISRLEAEDAGAEVVALDGLALAPGFIDIHTHYDAQVLWDPCLTPSCWHGVTSVVMGNCGFGVAPTRPDDRHRIVGTLENVEGMTATALESGIDWSFESFPEYLDALDRVHPQLNIAAFVGHTPVRLWTMGDDATERPATDEEIASMRAIVGEAADAGAIGFATSHALTHTGYQGRPVPSRLATLEEITTLADEFGRRSRGVIQATRGPDLAVAEFATLSDRIGRPVTWTALLLRSEDGEWERERLDEQASLPGEVWPQVACRPLVMQVTFSDPFPLLVAAAFKEVVALPREERTSLYTDPDWRARARDELADARRAMGDNNDLWANATVEETGRHTELVDGPTIRQLADQRGMHPLDLALDLSLEEDLTTRFRIVLANQHEDALADLLRDRRTVLGLSDAGAHLTQLCDASFSTYLLGHWVRDRRDLSLEFAVWRLTGQPAELFGLKDRGVVAPGAWADLVAFDPATVAPSRTVRVWDLPSGADRLTSRGVGIHHSWVAGEAICREGEHQPDVRPGRLLRAGR
jgi:N-acyl-D-aspartate/D-glutamate deacylase